MEPGTDEFGVPIKEQPQQQSDEFGIPIKKESQPPKQVAPITPQPSPVTPGVSGLVGVGLSAVQSPSTSQLVGSTSPSGQQPAKPLITALKTPIQASEEESAAKSMAASAVKVTAQKADEAKNLEPDPWKINAITGAISQKVLDAETTPEERYSFRGNNPLYTELTQVDKTPDGTESMNGLDYWMNKGVKADSIGGYQTQDFNIVTKQLAGEERVRLPDVSTKVLDDYMKYLAKSDPAEFEKYSILSKHGGTRIQAAEYYDSKGNIIRSEYGGVKNAEKYFRRDPGTGEIFVEPMSQEEKLVLIADAFKHQANILNSQYRLESDNGNKNPVDENGVSLREKYEKAFSSMVSAQEQVIKDNPGFSEIIDKQNAEAKKIELSQQSADEKYNAYYKKNPLMASIYYNFTEPVTNSLKNTVNNLYRIPESLGVDDLNAFSQFANNTFKESVTPTELKQDLYGEDGFNFSSLPSKTTRVLTDMLSLLYGAKGISQATTLGPRVSLLTSSFINTRPDYYDSAIESLKSTGMSQTKAEEYANNYANSASVLTSLLELVSPNTGLMDGFKKKATTEALRMMNQGATWRDAISTVWKGYLKEMPKEQTQEILQLIGDKASNAKLNEKTGLDVMSENITAPEVFETVVLTGIVTGFASLRNFKTPDQLQKSSIYSAAMDFDNFKQEINDAVESGKISPEEAASSIENVSQVKSIMNGIPNSLNLNAKQRMDIAALVYQKQQIMQQEKDMIIDPEFAGKKKEEINNKINAINSQIQEVISMRERIKIKEDYIKQKSNENKTTQEERVLTDPSTLQSGAEGFSTQGENFLGIKEQETEQVQQAVSEQKSEDKAKANEQVDEYQQALNDYHSMVMENFDKSKTKEDFVKSMMENDYSGEMSENNAEKYYSKVYDNIKNNPKEDISTVHGSVSSYVNNTIESINNDELKDTGIESTKDGFSGDFLNGYTQIGEGSEHTVYRSEDGSHVIKIGEPYNNNSDSSLSKRITDALLINRIIGDGSLEVIGYYMSSNGTKNPVYKQNYVEGRVLSEEEAGKFLEENGFKKGENNIYSKEIGGYNYEISDISENFMEDNSGKIVAIDAAINEKQIPVQENEASIKNEQQQIPEQKDDKSKRISEINKSLISMLEQEGQVNIMELKSQEAKDLISEREQLMSDIKNSKSEDNTVKDVVENQQVETAEQSVPPQQPVSEPPVPPQPPVSDQNVEEPGEGPKRRRSFAQTIIDDTTIRDEVKRYITDRNYNQIPNDLTIAEANSFIEENGLDASESAVTNRNNGLSPRVRITIGQTLVRMYDQQARQSKDEKEKSDLYNKAGNIANELARLGTEYGQAVQAFAVWDKLSVEGMIEVYKRASKKTQQLLDQRTRELKDNVKRAVNEGIDSASRKAVNDVSEANPKQTKKTKTFGMTKEQISEKKKLALEKLKKAFKQPPLTSGGINPDLFAAAAEYGYLSFADGFNTFKEWIKEMRAAGIDDEVSNSVWNNHPVANKKTLAELSKANNLSQVVSSNYKNGGDVNDLASSIEDAFGIPEDMAMDLAKEIDKQFKKHRKKEISDSVDNSVPKQRFSRSNKKAINRIKEEAIDDSMVDKLFEQEYGITDFENLSEDEKKKLNDLKDKLNELDQKRQSAPEGSFLRDSVTVEMLTEIGNSGLANSSRFGDAFWSMWYASVLSGHETQLLNFISNASNIILETGVSAVEDAVSKKDPVAVAKAISFMINGLTRGMTEAESIITEGGTAMSQKASMLEAKNVLEDINFGKGWKNPLNWYKNFLKYVPRSMSAVDTFFYSAANDLMAYETARDIAKKEGLTGEDLKSRIDELTGNSKEQFESAKLRADEEVNSFYDVNSLDKTSRKFRRDKLRRTYEIIISERNDFVNERAESFGKFVTYNYSPKGWIGSLANSLSSIGQKVPLFKFIVPFTRIVANVLNQQLDWTPYGYARAFGVNGSSWTEGLGGTSTRTNDTVSERNRELIKATTGTLLIFGLYAMAAMYDDGEEKDRFFDVIGKGPKDFNKKNQFYEQGKKPYSVKIGNRFISYQYSPLAIGLSFVGNWRDNEKYQDLGEKDFATKFGFALNNTASGIFDMSFLTGLSGFMDAIASSTDPEIAAEKFFKSAGRTATSFIPNFFKQIDNTFHDNTIYDAKTLRGAILSDIPIIRTYSGIKPKINVLGEKVEKDANVMRRFTSVENPDPVWQMLADKKLWVPGAKPSTKNLKGESMTDDEFYQYMEESGKMMKKHLSDNLEKIYAMDNDKAQKYINQLMSRFRKMAMVKVSLNKDEEISPGDVRIE